MTLLVPFAVLTLALPESGAAKGFDHEYAAYGRLLQEHVAGNDVDYARLKANRVRLDAIVADFGAVSREQVQGWSRAERLAYWINAYNVFTLQAIVNHYPIRGNWLSIHPRNSIRQIDGVWTMLTWQSARGPLTLDAIEHGIIRPEFEDPRIHFAVNCASIGCPPLRLEPYVGSKLDRQLDEATRAFLAGPHGTELSRGMLGVRLRVTSLFDWYGEDFVPDWAARGPEGRGEKERAALGFVAEYGPPEVAALARSGGVRLGFLPYDWSLNDVAR
jgi:hypothetical protein